MIKLLLIFLIPTYLVRFSLYNLPTNLFEILILSVFVLTCLTAAGRRRHALAWRRLPSSLYTAILLFLIACLISLFISPHPYASLGLFKGWVIFPLLLGWLSYTSKTGSVHVALILSGLLTTLLAILFGPQSIYDVPNSHALWLVPIIILTLHTRSFKFLALPQFLALLFTQSIGGLLALTLALIISPPYRNLGLILLSISAVVYLYNPSPHLPSLAVRQQLWSVSVDLISQHLFFGIGLGQFESAYQTHLHERFYEAEVLMTRSRLPLREFVFRDPHSWPLSMWLNTGLVGLISFISTTYLALKRPRGRAFSASQLALISVVLFGLVDTIYWKNDLATVYWLLIFSSIKALNTVEIA